MGEMVSFPSNGGTTDGYLALPRSGTGPGVVVIQEWWGLVGHVASIADRFAAEGFVALAPDLYRGQHTGSPEEASRLSTGLAMEQAAKDLEASARYLAKRPECTGRVGAAGFGMGGSLALWSGALSDDITAVVGFYPAIPWERMSPEWERFSGKHAVLHCSGEGGLSAAEPIQSAKQAIEAAGGECITYDYPGTRHAFFNDDYPEAYDHDASTLAWARTLEVFRTRLS
jgi:carboxymethylenebutenolidase